GIERRFGVCGPIRETICVSTDSANSRCFTGYIDADGSPGPTAREPCRQLTLATAAVEHAHASPIANPVDDGAHPYRIQAPRDAFNCGARCWLTTATTIAVVGVVPPSCFN